MPHSFNQALSELPTSSQKRIRKNINYYSSQSAKISRICSNLTNECKISKANLASMRALLDVFDHHEKKTVSQLLTDYVRVCRRNSMNGKLLSSKLNIKQLGRAVTFKTFKFRLMEVFCLSDSEAENIIIDYTKGIRYKIYDDLLVSDYPIWSTWSDDNSNLHPFHFCLKNLNSYELSANLGLSHLNEREDYLGYIFARTNNLECRFPTIHDAADYDYFKVSSPEAKYGLTLPRHEDEFKARGGRCVLKPRPETIHKPIQIKDIQLPLIIFQYD